MKTRHTMRGRQAGVTLVELMVGLLIGLFLVGVMVSMFIGSKGTRRAQDQLARLQENARFVTDTLSADVRMGGFRGCRGSDAAATLNNTLSSSTSHLYNFAEGLWASHHTGSAWSPALPTAVSDLGPATQGDVLTVRRSVGASLGLVAEMSSATSALTVSAGSTVAQGDVLMVSDCAGAAIFQVTNATPGATGAISHATGSQTPGNASASLGRAYLQDALVHRMATVTYYLAPSARSGKTALRALWSHTWPAYDGTPQPQELVTGVERLRLRYGLDTDSDGATDAYVSPDAMTTAQWAQIVTAQIEVLLVSNDDGVTTAAQPYTFDGTQTTPTDRRLRTVTAVTASVRNALR